MVLESSSKEMLGGKPQAPTKVFFGSDDKRQVEGKFPRMIDLICRTLLRLPHNKDELQCVFFPNYIEIYVSGFFLKNTQACLTPPRASFGVCTFHHTCYLMLNSAHLRMSFPKRCWTPDCLTTHF